MLDLVPFAGSRRQMADRNREASLRGKPLQLQLPQPVARPIRTAAICNNEEVLTGWIQAAPNAAPPAPDTLHGKLRGLVINAHIDEATVVDHIVNPIRNRFPVCDGAVIIDIDGRVLPFGLPFPPMVLEVSNEFLLLTIHGNHREALRFKGLPGSIDLLKLGVSISMRCPLDRLLVRFEAKSPSLLKAPGWRSRQPCVPGF